MALIIDLKPNEKFIIGDSLVINDKQKARLHIEGDAAILREKDIMLEKDANTPCKKVYLAIQLMYLSHDPIHLHEPYFNILKEIEKAAPSTTPFFNKINDFVVSGKYYKALKEAKDLIEYERTLVENARQ